MIFIPQFFLRLSDKTLRVMKRPTALNVIFKAGPISLTWFLGPQGLPPAWK
jgi:hypothetical protein